MAKWGNLGDKSFDLTTGAIEQCCTDSTSSSLYSEHDPVNNPKHYKNGQIECIDYIKSFLTKEEYIGYLRGNMAKYNHRARYKGKFVEDIEKLNWYSDKLIQALKEVEE